MGRRRKPVDPPGENQTAMRNAERFYKKNDDFGFSDRSVFLENIQVVHDAFNSDLAISYFKEFPGIFLIKNAIKKDHQESIVLDCLREAKAPNVTNLDTHYEIPAIGIWKVVLQDPNILVNLRPDNENVIVENDGRMIDPPTSIRPCLSCITAKKALRRLRWTSLGVQCIFSLSNSRSLGHQRISF
jgi:hypothetical protein